MQGGIVVARPATLILGLGNLLWADEGFGVRAAAALNSRYGLPPEATVLDGGTQGLALLPYLQAAEALLILDAVDYGLAPGTLLLRQGEEVPAFLGAKKMSLHQTGFQEVLALAAFTGWQPRHLALVGVQPLDIEDYGGGLTPTVSAMVEPAVEVAVRLLAEWGLPAALRAGVVEALQPEALEEGRYVAGRPSAEAACRIGDARFLPQAAGG